MNDRYEQAANKLGTPIPKGHSLRDHIDPSYMQGEATLQREASYPPPPPSPVEIAVECLNGNQQRIDELLGDLTSRLRMVIDHNEKDRVNLGTKECQTASCPLEARIINIQIGQCQTIERLHDLMGRLAL